MVHGQIFFHAVHYDTGNCTGLSPIARSGQVRQVGCMNRTGNRPVSDRGARIETMFNRQLIEAICLLTGRVGDLVDRLGQSNCSDGNNWSIRSRLDALEEETKNIKNTMSKLTDQMAAIKAFQDETSKDIDALVTSADAQATATAGLAGDIDELARKILELQNSQGGVTPEDQVLIDEVQSLAESARNRVKSAAEASAAHAAALQALDEKNPPVVPVPPTA